MHVHSRRESRQCCRQIDPRIPQLRQRRLHIRSLSDPVQPSSVHRPAITRQQPHELSLNKIIQPRRSTFGSVQEWRELQDGVLWQLGSLLVLTDHGVDFAAYDGEVRDLVDQDVKVFGGVADGFQVFEARADAANEGKDIRRDVYR